MAPPIRESIMEQLLIIIRSLRDNASFGKILSEARIRGVLAWDRTLRRYLDLLLAAKVLTVSLHDVGSVNPQQSYKLTGKEPVVASGLRILQLHGLSWDVPDGDFYLVGTDLSGLVKSHIAKIGKKQLLAASLEDSLAYELKKIIEGGNNIELVAGMIATHRLDIPYFIRRSDELGAGTLARVLFQHLEHLFNTSPGELDGRIFLPAREQFLRILRGYSKKKTLDIIEKGFRKGDRHDLPGMPNDSQLLQAVGKQLGMTG